MMRTWVCVTCKNKPLHFQGVPSHRAMHERRKEGPIVMENTRYRFTYDYREKVDE